MAVLGAATVVRPVHVQTDDMAPSILAGDWVLVGPGRIQRGTVVVVDDPTDPGHTVLRRVVGLDGELVSSRGGSVRLDQVEGRWAEMGRDPERVAYSEFNLWLVQVGPRKRSEPGTEMHVGPTQVLLLADNRDGPIDGRWWGPTDHDDLGRVVWVRWGSRDLWRDGLSWRAQDGPWHVPDPNRER